MTAAEKQPQGAEEAPPSTRARVTPGLTPLTPKAPDLPTRLEAGTPAVGGCGRLLCSVTAHTGPAPHTPQDFSCENALQ